MINLIYGSSNPALAISLAQRLGGSCFASKTRILTGGEINLRVKPEDVEGKVMHILQSLVSNDHVMELCLLARAAKTFGALKVTAIVPYIGYARQDKITIHGEIRALNCLLDMMQTAGIDKVVSADVHSHRTSEGCNLEVVNLETAQLFAHLVSDLGKSVIIAPDKGAYDRANIMAKRLKVPALMFEKKRLGPGKMKITDLPDSKHISNRDCYIVDDILDTGGTVCAVARALKQAGARSVTAFISHGLFGEGSAEKIQESPIDRIYVTNSITNDAEERPKTIVLDVSPIIADYLAGKENV